MKLRNLKKALKNRKIFSVSFISRRDGLVHSMKARSVEFRPMRFDPAKKNLLTVEKMPEVLPRMIPVENIISMRVEGRTYNVKGLKQL